jgi:hypothetical protein
MNERVVRSVGTRKGLWSVLQVAEPVDKVKSDHGWGRVDDRGEETEKPEGKRQVNIPTSYRSCCGDLSPMRQRQRGASSR